MNHLVRKITDEIVDTIKSCKIVEECERSTRASEHESKITIKTKDITCEIFVISQAWVHHSNSRMFIMIKFYDRPLGENIGIEPGPIKIPYERLKKDITHHLVICKEKQTISPTIKCVSEEIINCLNNYAEWG